MKSIRKIALGVLIACVAQFAVFPLAYGVTVEEAAGRKEKAAPPPHYEEFSGKATERRDDARASQEKDPRLACLLSLILPGSGHIYLKEDLKGVSFCLLTGIGYASSAYYLYLALYSEDLSQTEQKSKLIISGLLFVVAAIIHVVGIVEAYNDAIEINEKKFYYGGNRSASPYVAGIDYR